MSTRHTAKSAESGPLTMAKESKFGTFGGVFTPSILTILGVIMYLRLPWVVGQAGLYTTLAIIAVAHVISVSTGLSISSIATDKKVGAGGPYYIVSRSLGLAIGGTLGLALFVGLSFSVSLYIIGFSESFLAFIDVAPTPTAIRVCGSIVLVLITVVTLISTSLAIKTQYVIFGLIALSLASIFLGSPPPEGTTAHLAPPEDGEAVAVLFGIFFPAVTGFTAGVNMSGDLKDPRKSIPRGTMAAILSGLVVYVGLAVFVAFRVPPADLISNTQVLQDIAWVPLLVVFGVWGATLSSALGSIMGAPRILQALSADGIGPRAFAKGHGPSSEPRNALVVAFAIAEGGILIAELNAIARIVSMVFLTTYGFLNMSSAIESWASPDFRPAFRIPRFVSVLGAVTSVVVMIQLDLVAMMGASALMAILFFFLKRKQLTLEAGDTWQGIWSSLVRSGLFRLSQGTEQRRNWRPNILAFHAEWAGDQPESASSRGMGVIAEALVTGNGILSEFQIARGQRRELHDELHAPRPGVFRRRLTTDDPFETIRDVAQYHGLAGLSPNTVLLEHSALEHDDAALAKLLSALAELDKHILLYSRREGPITLPADVPRHVDVWWRPAGGNISLCIALLRFVSSSETFRGAELRFMVVHQGSSQDEQLRAKVRRIVAEARIEASVRIFAEHDPGQAFPALLQRESQHADLALVGLRRGDVFESSDAAEVRELARLVPRAIFFSAGSTFQELLEPKRGTSISFVPSAPDAEGERHVPEVSPPASADLVPLVRRRVEAYQRAVNELHAGLVERLYADHVQLVQSVGRLIDDKLVSLKKGQEGASPRQQQKLFDRAHGALLLECRKLFGDFKQRVASGASAASAQLETFFDSRELDETPGPAIRWVRRAPEDFRPAPGDGLRLLRFKRRRRWVAALTRRAPSYPVPLARLERRLFERASVEIAEKAVSEAIFETHRIAIELGKIVSSHHLALAISSKEAAAEADVLASSVERHRVELNALVEALSERYKARSEAQQWRLLVTCQSLCNEFVEALNRLDSLARLKRQRKGDGDVQARRQELCDALEEWAVRQGLLVERATLGLSLASFHHRVGTAVQKELRALDLVIKNGALTDCRELLGAIRELVVGLESGHKEVLEARPRLDLKTRFEPGQTVQNVVHEIEGLIDELPESLETLSDSSIEALAEGSLNSVEAVELPVRRLFRYLVESRFASGVQDALSTVSRAEQRLVSTAQDAERLIAFQLAEMEANPDEQSADTLKEVAKSVAAAAGRLETELAALEDTLPALSKALDQELQTLVESSNNFELTRMVSDLEQHIRIAQGRRAVKGARSLVKRAQGALRRFAIAALYRQSAGRVWAREQSRLRDLGQTSTDELRAFVEVFLPRPDVLKQLPYFYRQLFFGQATINDNFWVGRAQELRRARHAIQSFRDGVPGPLIITGERGAGKTALCQRVTARLLDRFRVFRLYPPPGGSDDPVQFKSALERATGLVGKPLDVVRALPAGSAIVMDDLELWWERGAKGLGVLSEIARLVDRQGHRVLFVLGVGSQALNCINRFLPLSDGALLTLECGPLSAEELKEITMLRHGSTGLGCRIEGKALDDQSDLRQARLFASYFEFSRGFAGAALNAWVSNIQEVSDDAINVRYPANSDWDVIGRLRSEWCALLVQVVLHKQLSRRRLRRVTGLDAAALEGQLKALTRSQILRETRPSVFEINPAVYHILHERFCSMGLLS